MTAAWDQDGFRARVQAALDAFLDEQAERLEPLGPDAARLVAEARTSVAGGKMFRASFCWWGHLAVAPPAEVDALVRACASLELLHASALVHDDYMDASDSRRGRPSTHRTFESEHRGAGWRGDPEQYGAVRRDPPRRRAALVVRRAAAALRAAAGRRGARPSTCSTCAAPR